MMADDRPRAQGVHAPADIGHEETDVRVAPILVAAAGLLVVMGVVLIVIQLLFQHYSVREAKRSPPANPLAGAYGRQAPPEPRLQTAPAGDLAALRASEEAALTSYGWVDRSTGVTRIPIERAIDLVAERGLPARSEAATASAAASTGREAPQ